MPVVLLLLVVVVTLLLVHLPFDLLEHVLVVNSVFTMLSTGIIALCESGVDLSLEATELAIFISRVVLRRAVLLNLRFLVNFDDSRGRLCILF